MPTWPVPVLPGPLNNSTLPLVAYDPSFRSWEFQSDATEHFLFDGGNKSCLTGVNGGVLTPNNGTAATEVGSIKPDSSGSGYTSAPTVTITGGGGSGAAATALIAGGLVIGFVVTAKGSGYTSAPTVSLSGGGGAGAAGTAVLGGEPIFVGTLASTPPSTGCFMQLASGGLNGLLTPYNDAATQTEWAVIRKDARAGSYINMQFFGPLSNSDTTTGHTTFLSGGVFDLARTASGDSQSTPQLASTAAPPVNSTWLFVATAQSPAGRLVYVGGIGTASDTTTNKATSSRKNVIGNVFNNLPAWLQQPAIAEYGIFSGVKMSVADLDAQYALAKYRMAPRNIPLL